MNLFYKKDETVFERVTNALALGLGAAFTGGALNGGAIMVMLVGLVFYLASQAYLARLKTQHHGLPRWKYSIPFVYLAVYLAGFLAIAWMREADITSQAPDISSQRLSNNEELNRAADIVAGKKSLPDCQDLAQRFPHTAPFMEGCEHLRQPSVAPAPLPISE